MRGLYLLSVWMHVLAAMTWIGGTVVFVIAVMPYFGVSLRRPKPLSSTGSALASRPCRGRVSRFSRPPAHSTCGRGVTLGDFVRREWHATAFGQLVMLKLTLVAVAVLLTIFHERLASTRSARWMGRSLLLVGLGIVAAAVMLVRTL